MIALIVSLKIKPDQRDRFLAAAEDDSICSVRDEGGGCVRFDVLEDQADPNHFFFYEVYRDQNAFEAHTRTPHFSRWRAAADVVLAEAGGRQVCTVQFPRDYT